MSTATVEQVRVQREAAEVLGVSHKTVDRDQELVSDDTPDDESDATTSTDEPELVSDDTPDPKATAAVETRTRRDVGELDNGNRFHPKRAAS